MTKPAIPARTVQLLRQRFSRIRVSPYVEWQLWQMLEWTYSRGVHEAEILRMERWKLKHTRRQENLQ